ncbi:hypothetical protein D3C85_1767390 [compost metagenome]
MEQSVNFDQITVGCYLGIAILEIEVRSQCTTDIVIAQFSMWDHPVARKQRLPAFIRAEAFDFVAQDMPCFVSVQ